MNILSVTAEMSIQRSLIALLLGVPLGIWLGACKFPGRNVLVVVNRTLMGIPPVVCGLLFYMLFSGVGPLRHMKLLFTVKIMVMAQVVLITPIVVSNMETYVAGIAPAVRETAKGLGLGSFRTFLLLCGECVYQIFSAYLLAFARSIAEVGAVSMVGGADVAKANELMEALQLCHLEKKRSDRLSGGETARMALARLMMRQFDLVILDEPTAAMDMETTCAAEKLIQDYAGKTGCALILVTHSLQQARRVADAVLFFRKGKLVESGEKAQALYTPAQPETKRFLEFYGQ